MASESTESSRFRLEPTPGPKDEAEAAFWPTPAWATEALLERRPLSTQWVIEPSAGDGAICEVLVRHGHLVRAVERREECWLTLSNILFGASMAVCAGMSKIVIGDWLEQDPQKLVGPMVEYSIVGNPPYNPAEEMLRHVKHAVMSKAVTVAMLLPTNFLHSTARAGFHHAHPFSVMLALARRPNTSPDGSGGGGMRDLSWFVWDRGKDGMRVEVVP